MWCGTVWCDAVWLGVGGGAGSGSASMSASASAPSLIAAVADESDDFAGTMMGSASGGQRVAKSAKRGLALSWTQPVGAYLLAVNI